MSETCSTEIREGQRLFGCRRLRQEDNIKMYFTEIKRGSALVQGKSGQGQAT